MTTFTHKITSVKTYSKNGLDDIVHTVRYELEGELNGKKQTSFMPITFSEPDLNNFTDFASLTEAQILAWVTAQLGQEEINAMQHGIDSFLNEQPDPLAPPVTTSVELPWGKAEILPESIAEPKVLPTE
jgi:hypothetical protein